MNWLKTSTVLAAAALALVACNRDDGAASGAVNPLLVHVPDDTPYLYANLEPTPTEVIDSFMLRAAPALSAVQELMGDLEIEINTQGEEMSEARLLSAIWDELNGKLSREGLESMGFSLESHLVIYGNGPFPVIRVSLANAQALRDAVERVTTKAGIELTEHELNETRYWKLADRQGQFGAYLAILDNQFAFGLIPAMYEEQWLPALLGQTQPDANTAAARLAQLNREKKFSAYGSGYVDLRAVAEEVLDESSVTASLLKQLGQYEQAALDETCKAEIRGMVAKAPRLIAGTTEMTPNSIGIAYVLEVETGLAGKLAELVADVPVADSGEGKVLTVALGLKAGRLKSFISEQLTELGENPFQCEKLAHVNQQVSQALAQVNQPVPFPFINNIKGFRASMDDFDPVDFKPENASGLFTLEVEKPQMLIGSAQMFVPGMAELDLEAGADPVAIPTELASIAVEGMQVYLAMDSDSIGVSLGENRQADLVAFMEDDEDNHGVFFSMEYDMSAQMKFQNRIQEKIANADPNDEDAQRYLDFQKRIQQSYMAWLGRTRVEMSFGEDGIRLNTVMKFQ